MIWRVLLLERDRTIVARMREALRAAGVDRVKVVSSVRDACLALTEQPRDLAFIPIENAKRHVRTLRALQEDLPVVLTINSSEHRTLPGTGEVFQGIVHTEQLEVELPIILSEATALRAEAAGSELVLGRELEPSLERLRSMCRDVDLGASVSLAVLSRGSQMLACGRQENDAWPLLVANNVGRTWEGGLNTTQVQFLRVMGLNDPLLLYTRLVSGYLLTLGGRSSGSVIDLRRHAEALMRTLFGAPEFVEPLVGDEERHLGPGPRRSTSEEGRTFAIVWRSAAPLPPRIRAAITDSIRELAAPYGCTLNFLSVEPNHVHLVVTCPPGRQSFWAAYVLKYGSQEDVQQKLRLAASLWLKGYYATESTQPLSAPILKLFAGN